MASLAAVELVQEVVQAPGRHLSVRAHLADLGPDVRLPVSAGTLQQAGQPVLLEDGLAHLRRERLVALLPRKRPSLERGEHAVREESRVADETRHGHEQERQADRERQEPTGDLAVRGLGAGIGPQVDEPVASGPENVGEERGKAEPPQVPLAHVPRETSRLAGDPPGDLLDEDPCRGRASHLDDRSQEGGSAGLERSLEGLAQVRGHLAQREEPCDQVSLLALEATLVGGAIDGDLRHHTAEGVVLDLVDQLAPHDERQDDDSRGQRPQKGVGDVLPDL
jgi:hypothetical protein